MSSSAECYYCGRTTDDMGKCLSCCSGKGGDADDSSKWEWEEELMKETIMSSGKVSHAAIVSFSDGELRAAGPAGYKPNHRGVKDIIEALKGNTKEIAENGIDLGRGISRCTPGKLDEGRAIYATDGKGGGCTIFKTKQCVLLVAYSSDPALATRLASEVAEHMEENDR